jgi:hypothetical protein
MEALYRCRYPPPPLESIVLENMLVGGVRGWSGVASTMSSMADLSVVVHQGLNDGSMMTGVRMAMVLFGIMIRSATGLARSMH